MHPRFLTQRNEAAQAVIEAAAQTLGQRLGLHESLYQIGVTDRDPDVQALLRREAVADLLNTLVDTVPDAAAPVSPPEASGLVLPPESSVLVLPPDLRDRLLAIRGVGESLVDVILTTIAQAIAVTDESPDEVDLSESPDGADSGALDEADSNKAQDGIDQAVPRGRAEQPRDTSVAPGLRAGRGLKPDSKRLQDHGRHPDRAVGALRADLRSQRHRPQRHGPVPAGE